MKKLIYLDNAAAAKPFKEVVDSFHNDLLNSYFNQEAVHIAAYGLKQKINKAGEKLAEIITGDCKNNILWSESGSALINEIFSADYFKDGNVITTEAEHPAIHAALNRSGAEVRKFFCKRMELLI